MNDFILNHIYKIEDFNQIFYTAKITKETEHAISFIDRDGNTGGLAKTEIKRWKEVKNNG